MCGSRPSITFDGRGDVEIRGIPPKADRLFTDDLRYKREIAEFIEGIKRVLDARESVWSFNGEESYVAVEEREVRFFDLLVSDECPDIMDAEVVLTLLLDLEDFLNRHGLLRYRSE